MLLVVGVEFELIFEWIWEDCGVPLDLRHQTRSDQNLGRRHNSWNHFCDRIWTRNIAGGVDSWILG